MKTAREYIETEYGTIKLARTVALGDVESLLDLIDDYWQYLALAVAGQALKDAAGQLESWPYENTATFEAAQENIESTPIVTP